MPHGEDLRSSEIVRAVYTTAIGRENHSPFSWVGEPDLVHPYTRFPLIVNPIVESGCQKKCETGDDQGQGKKGTRMGERKQLKSPMTKVLVVKWVINT